MERTHARNRPVEDYAYLISWQVASFRRQKPNFFNSTKLYYFVVNKNCIFLLYVIVITVPATFFKFSKSYMTIINVDINIKLTDMENIKFPIFFLFEKKTYFWKRVIEVTCIEMDLQKFRDLRVMTLQPSEFRIFFVCSFLPIVLTRVCELWLDPWNRKSNWNSPWHLTAAPRGSQEWIDLFDLETTGSFFNAVHFLCPYASPWMLALSASFSVLIFSLLLIR